MKLFHFVVLLVVLIITACASATPLPATNTPVPTAVPTPQKPMNPKMLFEINNDPNSLKDPYGIAVNSLGNIYVNDAGNSRIFIVNQSGNNIQVFNLP